MPAVGFPLQKLPAFAPAAGASVFVDKVAGSDVVSATRGSQAQPYRTLSAAVGEHTNGNTTFFVAPTGVYNEQVSVTTKSGTMRFTPSSTAARPVIDGGETLPRGFFIGGSALNFTVEGFEIRNQIQDCITTGPATKARITDSFCHHIVWKKGISTDINSSIIKVQGRGDYIGNNVIVDNVIPGEARGILAQSCQDLLAENNVIGVIRKEGWRDSMTAASGTQGRNVFRNNVSFACWCGCEMSGTIATYYYNNIFLDCMVGINIKHVTGPGTVGYPTKFENAKHPQPYDDDPTMTNWTHVDHNTVVRSTSTAIWNNETPPVGNYITIRNNLLCDCPVNYIWDFPVSPEVPYTDGPPPPTTVAQYDTFRGKDIIIDGNGYVMSGTGLHDVPERMWIGGGYVSSQNKGDPNYYSLTVPNFRAANKAGTPPRASQVGRGDPHAVELNMDTIGFVDDDNYNYNHPGTVKGGISVPDWGLTNQMGARNVPVPTVQWTEILPVAATSSHGQNNVANLINRDNRDWWNAGGPNYQGPVTQTFDMGAVIDFNAFKMVNYNHGIAYNPMKFDIAYSSTGTSIATASAFTTPKHYDLNDAEGGTNFRLLDNIQSARFIRITNLYSESGIKGVVGLAQGVLYTQFCVAKLHVRGQPTQLVFGAVSPSTPPVPSTAPTNTVAPTVTPASPQAGATLTSTNGTWTGAPQFTYQWQRGTTNIPNEIARTYVTDATDVGTAIRCRVHGANAAGAADAFSNAVTVTAPPPPPAVPENTSPPTVTPDPAVVPNVVTAGNGTWSPAASTFAYQWLRNGAPITPGGTGRNYTLQAADVGTDTVSVRVTASNAAGPTTTPAVSAPITVTAAPPPPGDTTPPTVSLTAPAANATLTGTVTLTATASDVDSAVAKVDFLRGSLLIASVTSSPYSVTWDTTQVPNGTYTLTARATDTAPAANVATSTGVTVTVSNTTSPPPDPPPPPPIGAGERTQFWGISTVDPG